MLAEVIFPWGRRTTTFLLHTLSCECTEKRLSSFTRVIINKHGSFVCTSEGCAGLQVCLAFWWLQVQKKRGINANCCFVADFFTGSLHSLSLCSGTEILFPVGKKTSLTRSLISNAGTMIGIWWSQERSKLTHRPCLVILQESAFWSYLHIETDWQVATGCRTKLFPNIKALQWLNPD